MEIFKDCYFKIEEKQTKSNKPVRCIETGIIYENSIVAKDKTFVAAKSIEKCCEGIQKTAGKYHWEYVTQKEIK